MLNIRSNRLIYIGLAVLAGILALLFIPPLFVNTDHARSLLIAALESHTGHTAQVEEVSASLVPRPHITFTGVGVSNVPAASTDRFLKIKKLEVGVSLGSLFSENPTVSWIKATNPEVNLELQKDGSANWMSMIGGEKPTDKELEVERKITIPETVEVEGGEVHYVNIKTQTVEDVFGLALKAEMAPNASAKITGNFTIRKLPVNIAATLGEKTDAPRDIEITLSEGQTALSFKGKFNRMLLKPHYAGTVSLNSNDVMPWLHAWGIAVDQPEEDEVAAPPTPVENAEPNAENAEAEIDAPKPMPPLPVQLSFDVVRDHKQMAFNKIDFTSGTTQATASGTGVMEEVPAFNFQVAFKVLDVLGMSEPFITPSTKEPLPDDDEEKKKDMATLLAEFEEEQNKPTPSIFDVMGRKNAAARADTGLPKDITVAADITIDKATMGAQRAITDILVNAELLDGEIIVTQATGKMTGKTQAIANGIIKRNKHGLSFDGNLEGQGESFKALMLEMSDSAFDLPDDEYGAFRFRTNIYYSPKEARLSELKLLAGHAKMTGAIIVYFEKRLRVESALGAKDIDFDTIIAQLNKDEKPVPKGELEEDEPNEFKLEWLRNLRSDVTLRARVDNFLFRKRLGVTSSFVLKMKRNNLSVSDISMRYDDKAFGGKWSMNTKGEFPFLDIDMKISDIDTSNLVFDFGKKTDEDLTNFDKNATGGRWSMQQLHYPYFNDFNGNVIMEIGKITHRGEEMTNVQITGSLQDSILAVSNFSATLWDGILKLSGNFTGVPVPGFSIKFSLTEADFEKMLRSFTTINNLNGVVAMTGSMAASGLNYNNWVQSSIGNIAITGRNVGINGFDLGSIVRAVAGVRSVADIVNATRLALPGGRTEFATIGGSINVESGAINTPGIRLKNELTNGLVTGTGSLMDWTMDIAAEFPLITVDKPAPTLTMVVKGPIDAPSATLDTKSLEAYVARVAAEKLIQRKPTPELDKAQ